MLRLCPAAPDEPDVAELIQRHFNLMREQSPPESCHVLSAEALDAEDVRLFALRADDRAVAIGALRLMPDSSGELKSMHTASERRGNGYGRLLLQGLVEEARKLGLTNLALETGSSKEHEPARRLYASEGFSACPPFGDYIYDPLSLFMSRKL
ncbi:MAG: GNAT family N-acetyltransferase [Pseudomonadota bacterium]